MKKILVLHGPNLNLLGAREPHIYGSTTLGQINHLLEKQAQSLGYTLDFFQSNTEGDLIDKIQQSTEVKTDFILINPAALCHTSIALRDAFLATAIPFIEIHLSNIYAREPFRHHSYLSDIALGVVSGFGSFGYELALDAAHRYLAIDTTMRSSWILEKSKN